MLLGLEAKLTPGTTGGHYGGAGDLRTPPWRKPARPTGAKGGGDAELKGWSSKSVDKPGLAVLGL